MTSLFSVLSVESVSLFIVTLMVITKIQHSRALVHGYCGKRLLWGGSHTTLGIAVLLPVLAGVGLVLLDGWPQQEFSVIAKGCITVTILVMIFLKNEYPDNVPIMEYISAEDERGISHSYFFIYMGTFLGLIIYEKEWILLYPLGVGFLVGYLSYYLFKKKRPYKKYHNLS